MDKGSWVDDRLVHLVYNVFYGVPNISERVSDKGDVFDGVGDGFARVLSSVSESVERLSLLECVPKCNGIFDLTCEMLFEVFGPPRWGVVSGVCGGIGEAVWDGGLSPRVGYKPR